MEQPEIQWLAEYRKGNVESLGKLVEHYRRPLYAFILKMTQNHADADEVFQEVWFRAIRSMDTYKQEKFLSWLFRIAHNLVIDRARKAKPMVDLQRNAGEGDEDPIESRVAGKGLGPDAEVSSREVGRRIIAAVEKLPEDQKEVFLMRTEADLSFKEIAKIQRVSINTALARMQYALNKLRLELQGDYDALARGS